ncbi:hypothetical protein SDC9_186904 [bioreactor metagenome]|uniref:Uncharacterized protein n=1 Tax=bioreactor metagenome TaxID=1076179 RepID=A0A645HL95_9ZZZZ
MFTENGDFAHRAFRAQNIASVNPLFRARNAFCGSVGQSAVESEFLACKLTWSAYIAQSASGKESAAPISEPLNAVVNEILGVLE